MKNKIKILHLITSLRQGGAQRILCELIYSTSNTFEHTIWVLMHEENAEIFIEAKSMGIKIYSINNQNPFLFLKSIFKLFNFIETNKPNLIQTWLYHSDLFSVILKNKKIPILWNIRHSNSKIINSPIHRIITIRACILLSHFIPKKIISCSNSGIKYHKRLGYAKKFIYIPNGTARNNDFLKIKKFRNEIINIGFFHRFNAQKDIKNFLKACFILKNQYSRNINIIMGGTNMNEHNEKLMSLIKKYNLKKEINLKGFIKNIGYNICQCDLTVMSSMEGEGCPNIIIESISYQVPVVATNCGDSEEIVGECGYIVPIKSPNSLASKINLLIDNINNKKEYEKLKSNCQKRWEENFQKINMINKYKDTWIRYSKNI